MRIRKPEPKVNSTTGVKFLSVGRNKSYKNEATVSGIRYVIYEGYDYDFALQTAYKLQELLVNQTSISAFYNWYDNDMEDYMKSYGKTKDDWMYRK